MMHKPTKTVVAIFGFGVTLLLFFTLLFLLKTGDLSAKTDLDTGIWSDYGTLVAGTVGVLFTVLSAYFLMVTLLEQRKNAEDQKINLAKQQIETRFFNLLNIHRMNVAEMDFRGKRGKKVFIDMKDDFHDTLDALNIKMNGENKLDPVLLVNVAYLTWFFGVKNRSTSHLKKEVKMLLNEGSVFDQYENCLKDFEDNGVARIPNENSSSSKTMKPLELTGHQSRLGHYFRHLFQTVTYIDNSPFLNYDEKYSYIKTLRAQLTTHEQAIFLYNSLSTLGAPWEKGVGQNDKTKHLITKYNLVKNLPQGFCAPVHPEEENKNVYPLVQYEFQTEPVKERAELERIYRASDNGKSPVMQPSRSE